jgi:hypothetical protein
MEAASSQLIFYNPHQVLTYYLLSILSSLFSVSIQISSDSYTSLLLTHSSGSLTLLMLYMPDNIIIDSTNLHGQIITIHLKLNSYSNPIHTLKYTVSEHKPFEALLKPPARRLRFVLENRLIGICSRLSSLGDGILYTIMSFLKSRDIRALIISEHRLHERSSNKIFWKGIYSFRYGDPIFKTEFVNWKDLYLNKIL